ncbi:hypothetical protein kam1_1812 [Methylacidiphilum kamchatkense Kam1]|uniref:Uncharacterized protein n=1 Tax=Methylacidiphilum kamchatkense Kam1 TaxID=1202785 RepID=A0A516TP54_9BACT|nr:hypothetical protein kam1_1812 [Methylacidiphilum kamchatkense Kam1]
MREMLKSPARKGVYSLAKFEKNKKKMKTFSKKVLINL